MVISINPSPPNDWLAVCNERTNVSRVYAILESEHDPKLASLFVRLPDLRTDPGFRIVMDSPSLKVSHSGIPISSPADLAARANWFQRFAHILTDYLGEPVPVQVYTLARGNLDDPFRSLKTTSRGPCPLPEHVTWPRCNQCESEMAFLGVLDCRGAKVNVPLPDGSLVLHLCTQCMMPYPYSCIWLLQGQRIIMVGDGPASSALVGTRWSTSDFRAPCTHPDEISNDVCFLEERAIYLNFSCFGDKVGGRLFWIQNDDTPLDSRGEPMTFIGQLVGSSEVELGDAGVAYIFVSPNTGETKVVTQCF